MKHLITTLTLFTVMLISIEVSAQQTSTEVLTIIIDWEPNGKNQVFISEKGKETVQTEINGKFQEKGLAEVTSNLNELLNRYETNGWTLFSTFTMQESQNIQCFIFKKEE